MRNIHNYIRLFVFGGLLLSSAVIFSHASGESAQKVYSCVKTNGASGPNIRIVEANTMCAKNETLLSWNTQGSSAPTQTGERNNHGIICGNCIFRRNIEGKWVEQNFSNSIISDTIFENKDNRNEFTMTGVIFDNSIFDNTSFITSGGTMNISQSHFTSVIFKSSFFIGTPSKHVNLVKSIFTGAKFKGSGFIYVDASQANFSGSTLDHNNESDGFVAMDLTGSNFTNAIFSNWNFRSVNLTGATGFASATFSNVQWVDTICPDGTNSDINNNSCIGHF